MTTLKETHQLEQQTDVYDSSVYPDLIRRSLRYLSIGYPVHFTGGSGIGKTSLALHVAKQLKRPILFLSGNRELSNEDLIGAFSGYDRRKLKDNYVRSVLKLEENVTESWQQGRLYEAVKNGYTVIYDEFTRSQPETNNLFLSILQENILPLYGTKRTASYIDVHPEFSVIFTSNPIEYTGVYQTQDALLDRMVNLPLDPIDQETEVRILLSKVEVTQAEAEVIVSFVGKARELCSENSKAGGPSLRTSIMIAKTADQAQIPIDGKDEEFQKLCLDMTLFTLVTCGNEDSEKIKNKVITACKNIERGESNE
ncbi:gas vesicle protein GvpN [Thalassobacillus sp. CUG 92003]|uniref:gas vesicle protein GvpN n=1 Tax=Thalassobacillus sp. CUG 92003 TaxID=2736641 RepID=UPI0015E7469D|nr:gas vesicle protein GvpN [Thalassobacillus sp. CUG 92003]